MKAEYLINNIKIAENDILFELEQENIYLLKKVNINDEIKYNNLKLVSNDYEINNMTILKTYIDYNMLKKIEIIEELINFDITLDYAIKNYNNPIVIHILSEEN